ncbi:MAG: hypothetical protein ABJA16_06815 [Nakamurella sp.]
MLVGLRPAGLGLLVAVLAAVREALGGVNAALDVVLDVLDVVVAVVAGPGVLQPARLNPNAAAITSPAFLDMPGFWPVRLVGGIGEIPCRPIIG